MIGFRYVNPLASDWLLRSQYLVELTMMDGEHFLKYLPSVIGTSAVWLANHTLGITGCVSVIPRIT